MGRFAGVVSVVVVGFGLSAAGQTQTATAGQVPPPATVQPQGRSAGGDVGSGAGDIGKGMAKGVGAAAKGVGKGVVDLVTLHPLNAAGNVGKGAAYAGKDIGVGAVKGTGKIAKGTGRAIKHIF